MSTIGIGLIGFGWMGQAHTRSYRRIPTLFPDGLADPRLVIVSDSDEVKLSHARAFGFEDITRDWRAVVDDSRVDAVVVTAPNMLHLEIIEAVTSEGKHVFCEKPVGGTPEQTVRAEALARRSGANSGVGYNYRFTPLVQYAKRLIDEGSLGEIVGYRGRFFTMFGADPMGHLSWRFRKEEGGYGVSTDILSHAVDLAHMLVGPIRRVVGASATFIKERPLPTAAGTHYARGSAEDPRGEVTNEDYAAMLAEFENGARGTFETSRTFLGPESQMAFDLYGTKGAVSWNFERMNELQLYLVTDSPHSGYTTVLSGDRFRHHGAFVPGNANSIGFEDVVTIEDYEFLQALARGVPHVPGFREAVDYVSVQETLIRSWKSQQWEDVLLLHSQ